MTIIELKTLQENAEYFQSLYTEAQLLFNRIQQLETLIKQIQDNEINTMTINNVEIDINHRIKPSLILALKNELNEQQQIFSQLKISERKTS